LKIILLNETKPVSTFKAVALMWGRDLTLLGVANFQCWRGGGRAREQRIVYWEGGLRLQDPPPSPFCRQNQRARKTEEGERKIRTKDL